MKLKLPYFFHEENFITRVFFSFKHHLFYSYYIFMMVSYLENCQVCFIVIIKYAYLQASTYELKIKPYLVCSTLYEDT